MINHIKAYTVLYDHIIYNVDDTSFIILRLQYRRRCNSLEYVNKIRPFMIDVYSGFQPVSKKILSYYGIDPDTLDLICKDIFFT